MGKIALLFLIVIWVCIAECQAIAIAADVIPKDQQAQIEGLCYSALLSPAAKENWPDLRSFNILSVTGDQVGNFSKTEAIVGPGDCSVTVEVKTRQRGSATLTLTFHAEAGGKYVLRPVYRGKGIAATIQNMDTGEYVARTWPTRKSRSAQESNALVDAP
jgi:hypothetical protein